MDPPQNQKWPDRRHLARAYVLDSLLAGRGTDPKKWCPVHAVCLFWIFHENLARRSFCEKWCPVHAKCLFLTTARATSWPTSSLKMTPLSCNLLVFDFSRKSCTPLVLWKVMPRARQTPIFHRVSSNVVADVVAKNDTPLMQFPCFRFFRKILHAARFVKSDASCTPI